MEAPDGPFPEKTYLLTLPTKVRLAAGDVVIRENGQPVHQPRITAAYSADSNQFGVVLAIDASTSMRGDPLAKAMDAARAFARRTDAYQQLGAIAFNDDTQVLLPFTADRAKIGSALSGTPEVAYYTRMYEALDQAIEMIEQAGIRNASIVLLSDGQELGSKGTLEGAVKRAQKSGVRIFGIGLDSRFFDSRPLRTLALSTGGSYLQAKSPDELSGIFDLLGAQLSNEYLVSYDSLAGPGERDQGADQRQGHRRRRHGRVRHTEPGRSREGPGGALRSLLRHRLLAFALDDAGNRSPLRGARHVPRGGDRAAELEGPACAACRGSSRSRRCRRGAPERNAQRRLAAGTERSLERARWWAQFRDDVELAEMQLSPERIALVHRRRHIVAALVMYLVAGCRLG